MIIFGTKGVTTTKDQGSFTCPRCGEGTPYKTKRVRRFFTLYFIPVIPMDLRGEYVECGGCARTYDLDVLQYNPSQAREEFQAVFMVAMKQLMIAMAVSDGTVDDKEIQEFRTILKELAGIETSEVQLRQDIKSVQLEGADPIAVVAKFASSLNDNGRELLLSAAYRIAAADGHLAPEELQLLERIGTGLGMSRGHFRGVLAEWSKAPN